MGRGSPLLLFRFRKILTRFDLYSRIYFTGEIARGSVMLLADSMRMKFISDAEASPKAGQSGASPMAQGASGDGHAVSGLRAVDSTPRREGDCPGLPERPGQIIEHKQINPEAVDGGPMPLFGQKPHTAGRH